MFAVMAKNLPQRQVGFGLIVKYYTRSKWLPATITQTYLLGVTKEKVLEHPMFVERKVCYSALFTNLVRWHAGAVSFPLSDIILALLACSLSDIIFCLHSGRTNLSLYKH
jgi:hypothetical protein